MILGIMEKIEKFVNEIGKFIEKNFDHPLMWVIIFGLILLIALYGISKFADK